MKNTWLRLLFSKIILITVISKSLAEECSFPESEVEPFFFDVRADTPIESIIVDTVVDPPGAQVQIVNVRSNNVPDIDFAQKFRIEQRANGQFMVINRDYLFLPDYPSFINETYLYMTVVCNTKAYPLITLRIKNYNTYLPKFYNLPYEVELPDGAEVNTIINTPVLAMDRDPFWTYSIKYSIVSGQYADEFALIPSRTDFHKLRLLPNHFKSNRAKWHPEQLPPVVKLHVQRKPRKHEYNLNISATDSGNPPRTTFTNLKVIVGESKEEEFLKFTQPEYFANFSRLMTVDTEIVPHAQMTARLTDSAPKYLYRRSRVMYELMDSDYSNYFLIDPRTAQIIIRKKLLNDIPSMFALRIKAFLETEPTVEATTTLSMTDIADSSLTYFSKCFYEVHLQENAYPDTRVLSLQIHGEPDEIKLVNGTKFFRIDPLGNIYVIRPLDREKTKLFVLQAQVIDRDRHYRSDAKLCLVATITIHIDDVNDHTPRFEKFNYVFYTEELPYNNTEIGTVKATDADKGKYGKVHYRILYEESEDVPFSLFQADGVATIYYVTKETDFYPEKMYSFPIEAYDDADDPRSSRVSVQVIMHPKPESVEYDVEDSDAVHVRPVPRLSLEIPESAESSIDPVPITVEREQKIPIQNLQKSNPYKPQAKTIIRPMSNPGGPTSEKFESDSYKFLLYGSLQENQYVGTIRIPNQSPNVRYELEAGIRGFFKVDPIQGHLTVDKRLLEDEYEEIRFTALAKLNGHIVANTIITVILDDSISIYELSPRFEQSLYRFEIDENKKPSSLGTVQAHHRAVEINNDKVIYGLKNNENSLSFSIDPQTGQLKSKTSFDREKKHLYTIEIVSCLKSNSSSCGESEVAIVVLDVNDNPPVFEQTPYQVTISADIEPGTEIITLKATDSDLGRNAQIRFELITDGNGNFEIDESTGDLSYVGTTSLKVNRKFNLKVRAIDNGSPSLTSETTVVINVEGENPNPNPPAFENFRYEVLLPAIVPPNTRIVTVEANDADEGPEGEVFYVLRDDPDPRQNRILQLFELDEETGELWSRQTINAETDGPLIQLVVEAHDRSVEFPRKAETVVMIRFQELRNPKLEFVPLPKTVFISNEKSVGSEIIGISAKTSNENDQYKVRYSISQPADADFFVVPASSGSLRVKNKLIQGRFPITLIAFLPGTKLNATHNMVIVVMTDRDKYPVFEKLGYEMNVPMSAAFPVKLDPLNATLSAGRIEYSLYQAERLPEGISVDKMTGQLTIFEEFLSAFDGIENVFVVIRARNLDFPSFYSDVGVNLVLSDTSTALSFKTKLYRLVMSENKQQGTTLEPPIEVQNAAEIGDIEYYVEPRDSLFSIDNKGLLYLKKTIDLEELPQSSQGIIDLTVVAVHGDDKATTKVQVKVEDENEFSPVFLEDQYDFEIRHQPKIGEIIGTVRAIDEDFTDKKNLKYEIIEKSGAASSMINMFQNGSIAKKPGEEFKNGIYEMIVKATDYVGHNAEVVVSFYVQLDATVAPDNHHIEEDWQVSDNKIIGSKFTLFGLPNARWQFVIANGNDDGMFELREINDTMAELEIVTEPNVTESTLRKVSVEIINADNRGQTMMESINVDLSQAVAKKIPHFIGEAEDKEVKLAHNFNPNSVVITAKAVQLEGSDKITYELSDNPEDMFEINRTTGEITFSRNNKPKLPGVYQVRVKATATNPKTKVQHSSEEIFVVEIMTISSGEVLSTPLTSATSKESSSGVKPTSSRPQTSAILTEVSVSPPTKTTSASAQIPLLVFDQPQYSFMVDNPRRGSKVGELQILDERSLETSLKLEVRPREMSNIFRVDEETREIFLSQVPQESGELQEFIFNVTAVDANDPRRRSQTEVSVTMIPSDFELPDITGENIDESETPTEETLIGKSTENHILPPATAATVVTHTVSNEVSELAPSAKPINPVESSHQPPSTGEIKFASSEFRAMLPEGKYGSTIVQLKPHSLNQGMPPGTVYQIEAFSTLGNDSLPFSIREDTGDLIAFGDIDRETSNSYEFIVTATVLNSDPPVIDSAVVEIQILDVNDNTPEFVNPKHAAALASSVPVGTVVANFAVNDPDEGSAGKVSFSLEGDHAEFFSIDEAGTLTVAKPLTGIQEKVPLRIVVNDGGRPASRNEHVIEIDLYSQSSSRPEFKESEHSALVSGDAQRRDFVAHVVAGTGNFTYTFDNTFSDLFVVNNNGEVTLGRNPIDSEKNKDYTLNLTATDERGQSSSMTLTVFIESPPTTTTVTTTTTENTEMSCSFSPKFYNATVPEHTAGRTKLTQISAECKNLPRDAQVVYFIHQGADEFEINESTGELFVTGPLDRENRTLHFIVVNMTILTPDEPNERLRNNRQSNPIVERAKSRLAENQALVVVRVLDINDHIPKFSRVNSDGKYVFVVDWQTKPPKSIAKIMATDEDEKPVITYSFSEPSEYFFLNSTTGVITLTKSLEFVEEVVFVSEVIANDGEKKAKTKIFIYPLMPGTNIVVVALNNPPEEINELAVSREMTRILETDTRVLSKQVYVDKQNKVHPDKSHLLVYALKKETHDPIPADELKSMLEQVKSELDASEIKIESITLPTVASRIQMSNWEILVLIIALVLLITTCIICIFLLRCFKRRASLSRSDTEYMVDAESNGPRPYNVELISRRTAQTMLANRDLPNPFEDNKLSPQSRASLLTSSGMLFTDAQLNRSLPSLSSPSQPEGPQVPQGTPVTAAST